MAGERSARPIAVFGANGQVGHELPRALKGLGDIVAFDRSTLDLRDADAIADTIRRLRPRAIVNAAAYTAVDRAESEPDLARQVNALAPGIIAAEAARAGACIVHYSTDYVFDGRSETPYSEGAATNPLSVYGATKLAGEQAVAGAGPRHLIFRTSWVLGVHGHNFLKTILRLARERDALRIVDDQHGAPTTARLIADVTAGVLAEMIEAPATDPRWGVYHLAAGGETTWYTYATRVIRLAGDEGIALRCQAEAVVPIATAEYPTAAVRPLNSRLDTMRLRSTFGVDLPPWTEGVDAVLRELLHAPAQ